MTLKCETVINARFPTIDEISEGEERLIRIMNSFTSSTSSQKAYRSEDITEQMRRVIRSLSLEDLHSYTIWEPKPGQWMAGLAFILGKKSEFVILTEESFSTKEKAIEQSSRIIRLILQGIYIAEQSRYHKSNIQIPETFYLYGNKITTHMSFLLNAFSAIESSDYLPYYSPEFIGNEIEKIIKKEQKHRGFKKDDIIRTSKKAKSLLFFIHILASAGYTAYPFNTDELKSNKI